MRPGGGRAKGAAFERHVAKLIVTAFAGEGITAKDCYRTPLSGGHIHASKSDPGDLVMSRALRKLFPYSVECKHYRDLEWPKLLSSNSKGEFAQWWAQACKAAGNLAPVLIFRQNRSSAFAMVRKSDALGLYPYIATEVNGDRVRIVELSQLLESVVCSLPK